MAQVVEDRAEKAGLEGQPPVLLPRRKARSSHKLDSDPQESVIDPIILRFPSTAATYQIEPFMRIETMGPVTSGAVVFIMFWSQIIGPFIPGMWMKGEGKTQCEALAYIDTFLCVSLVVVLVYYVVQRRRRSTGPLIAEQRFTIYSLVAAVLITSPWVLGTHADGGPLKSRFCESQTGING